jgi:ABC-type phosphate transport system ATPase subunit
LESYLTAERAAGGQNQRYGLNRMVALSPELQLA